MVSLFFLTILVNHEYTNEPWEVRQTGIFEVVLPKEVIVADTGLFLIDRSEKCIRHFDVHGKSKARLGGKPPGLGTFMSLIWLQHRKNKIYGFDKLQRRIQVYATSGNFVTSLRPPASALFLSAPAQKVNGGWVYLSPDSNSIILGDESFVPIATLVGSFTGDPFEVAPKALSGSRYKKYNPAPDRPLFQVNSEGNQVYCYEPDSGFKITVFDVKTGTKLRSIDHAFAPVPLPFEWAEDNLKDLQKQSERNLPFKVEWEADFPKVFPAVQHFQFDPDGHLRFFPGARYLNPKVPSLVLDARGRKLNSNFKDADVKRILAIQDTWAYLSIYTLVEDGGKEFGIKKLPLADTTRFLTENPDLDFLD